ncbi:MAG: acyl-CoA desaturase [bacterium]|nr:acyl-CoA desaturase [bacterium]MCP5068929.1 acyl-CoA desaturase [bacterium]
MLNSLLNRYERAADEQVRWISSIPFFLVHLLPLAAIWTGVSAQDLALCFSLFFVRMFFITAGYHRYFSHRAFQTSRVMQFIFALVGGMAAQKGALWWAAHHRHHHEFSDQPEDIHSPMKGFWWSHLGWIVCEKYEETDLEAIPDFARYPELVFLNRWHLLPPALAAIFCFLVGGWSGLWIGFFLSTALGYHATFAINSLTHIFGRRRYATTDTSRNSLIMALITFGEGWHNNHHHYQASANMGFYWWEIDISYYVLLALKSLGIVRNLRRPPQKALESQRIKDGNADIGMLAIQEPA